MLSITSHTSIRSGLLLPLRTPGSSKGFSVFQSIKFGSVVHPAAYSIDSGYRVHGAVPPLRHIVAWLHTSIRSVCHVAMLTNLIFLSNQTFNFFSDALFCSITLLYLVSFHFMTQFATQVGLLYF